jgi:hypothetical protein
MKLFCLSLLCSAGLILSARADLTITQKVEGIASPLSTITTKVKGNKARVDASSKLATIIDSTTGEMWTLLKDQKQVMHISSDKSKALADMANKYAGDKNAGSTPKLVPTGRKETINGYETAEYKIEGSSVAASCWIALRYPHADIILKQMEQIRPGPWNAMKRGMPEYSQFPGLPIRTIVQVPGKGQIVTTIESISEETIPEDQFGIPKDYAEMKIPDFSSMMKAPGASSGKKQP